MRGLIKKVLCLIIISALCAPLFSGCEISGKNGNVRLAQLTCQGSGITIEVENTGRSEISLEDYIIKSNGEKTALYGNLAAGGSAIFSFEYPVNPGDKIELYLNDTIDSIEMPELINGTSYGITGSGWRFFTELMPRNNGDGFASLAEALYDASCPIIINEIMPNGAEDSAWVELYNRSDNPVNLSDYDLCGASISNRVQLKDGVLGAREYLVLYFKNGGSDKYDIPFPCSGTSLFLVKDSSIVYTISWSESLAPMLSCGIENGKSVYYTAPTPGFANGNALSTADITEGRGSIVINEVLLKNTLSVSSLSGRRTAWVELYNSGSSDVSLSGLFLSNDSSDPFKWALPDISLGAGCYTVIFFCGKNAVANLLEAPFTLSAGDSALYLTDVFALKRQTAALDWTVQDNSSLDASGQMLPLPTPGAGNQPADISSQLRLIINEVCSVHEAKSNKNDWIELYNPTDKAVKLDGLYLSDSKKELDRHALKGTIPAGGYFVVKTSDINISSAGEKIYLSNTDYIIDIFNAPKLLPQYTAGRNGGAEIYLMPPTPGTKNSSDTLAGYCSSPVFSNNGGYYASGLTLSITSQDSDARIYYTLDGSAPNEQSTCYTAPITISKTTVVRSICLRNGYAQSMETVGTFRTGNDKHSLPVVCLSMDKTDLNYICASASRLDVRERAGYIECYGPDGKLQAAFPAGLSIGGNSTRQYPQKTFNVHLRGAYGQNEVTYPFFKNNAGIYSYTSLSLRNCGQDAESTRLRDAFVSMAANGMRINNAQTYFAVVYVNGKYNGLYEFKENQNEDYLAAHTGCDSDTVQIVRANTNVYNKIGTNADIKALIAFATNNDCSRDDIYAQYLTYIDEDYYTDYLIALAFFMLSDAYNQKSIRSMDGIVKWQPILFDLDNGMGTSYKRKILGKFFTDDGLYTPSGFKVETVLFNAFYKNAGWREKFILRYAELLNSTLKTENLLTLFESMVESIRPEMDRNCKKWGTPSSYEKWESNIAAMRTSINNRRKYAIEELAQLFNVSNERLRQLFPDDLDIL